MRLIKQLGVGHHPFSKKYEFKGYFNEPTPALIATDYKAPKTVLELWCDEDNEKGGDKHKGLGYCDKHYQRFKKYGDPHFKKRRARLLIK